MWFCGNKCSVLRNTLINVVRSYVNDSQIQPNSTFIYLSTCQFIFHILSVYLYLSVICHPFYLFVYLYVHPAIIYKRQKSIEMENQRSYFQCVRTVVNSRFCGEDVQKEKQKKAWLRTINSRTCLAGTLALLLGLKKIKKELPPLYVSLT